MWIDVHYSSLNKNNKKLNHSKFILIGIFNYTTREMKQCIKNHGIKNEVLQEFLLTKEMPTKQQ